MTQPWKIPTNTPLDPNDLDALGKRIAVLRVQLVAAGAQLDQAEAALGHLRRQRGQA